jgi:hypothetical protein
VLDAGDAGDGVLDLLGDLCLELGTSILGNRVIGSVRKETMPSATSTTKRRMGGTGLRIAQAEMFQFIARPPR